MPADPTPDRYQVADLLIDGGTQSVTRGGNPVPLPGLSFDLFWTLVRAAPRTVTTDELMELVWKGRVVNAETVTKRVELVREALGDDGQEPRYVAVVRGRGYRLVAPVSPATAAPAETAPAASRVRRRTPLFALGACALLALVALAWWWWPTAGVEPGSTPSIAVMPFLNLSDDESNAHFSDGIAEEILGELSRIPGLRVASRTSSFAFRDHQAPMREIASTLGVDHVVEGSVRKAGNRIRVTAQLIEVSSDSHLWAESYDRELSDIFAIQKEIAQQIASALSLTLRTDARAAKAEHHDPEAYQLYLRGSQVWQLRGSQNIQQGIALLERAVELDPDLAQAHAALAITYALSPMHELDPELGPMHRSEQAAQRAITLDPTLSQPFAALGLVSMTRRQWNDAEIAYRRAISLNPNDALARYWLGELYAISGRTRDSLATMQETHRLDPISLPLNGDIAILHLRNGDFTRGCSYVDRAVALMTDDIVTDPFTLLRQARCREHAGDTAGMLAAEQRAERIFEYEQPLSRMVREAVQDPALTARTIAAIQAETARGKVTLASHYRALGDNDTAMALLERAMERNNYNALRDVWESDAKAMRALPRFRAFVENIGLVDYWRATAWADTCRPEGDSFTCE